MIIIIMIIMIIVIIVKMIVMILIMIIIIIMIILIMIIQLVIITLTSQADMDTFTQAVCELLDIGGSHLSGSYLSNAAALRKAAKQRRNLS